MNKKLKTLLGGLILASVSATTAMASEQTTDANCYYETVYTTTYNTFCTYLADGPHDAEKSVTHRSTSGFEQCASHISAWGLEFSLMDENQYTTTSSSRIRICTDECGPGTPYPCDF